MAARLDVWGIVVEDAAGLPFGRTLPGVLLDLVAAAVEKQFEPVALMTLLKHPLCRAGMAAGDMRRAISALELAAFRSPYFGKGLEGVEAALEGAQSRSWRHAAVRRLKDADWQAARDLLKRLAAIFAPVEKAFASAKPASVHDLARLHFATAQALAKTSDDDDGSALRQGEAGEWAVQFFASLIDKTMPAPDMAAADYPDFYRTLVAEKSIRSRRPLHPRISICDPFEARLQQAMSSSWVRSTKARGRRLPTRDPGSAGRCGCRWAWLRPRSGSEPRRMISCRSSARSVSCSRAPPRSTARRRCPRAGCCGCRRWSRGSGWSSEPEQPWLAWAQVRSAISGPVQPVRAPEPRPPVAHRPRELSVTTIETWIANPYAVFARRILRLEPLPLLGEKPGPALRGQIVHEALGQFAHRFPEKLPKDIAKELMAIAEAVLADYTGNPRVAAFWAPRLARFAGWFAETEAARRAGMTKTVPEVGGKMVLCRAGGAVHADGAGRSHRCRRRSAHHHRLQERSEPAKSGRARRRAARRRSFRSRRPSQRPTALPTCRPDALTLLRYISTSGGEPPGQDVPLKVDDVTALARSAQEGLARLIAEFDRETTPYRAVRRARFKYDYDDYAHLARVAEWLVDNGEED